MDSPKPLHSINSQNPPSVTKFFIAAPECKATKHSCQNKPSFVGKYSYLHVIMQPI